jgi:hypothetical protein
MQMTLAHQVLVQGIIFVFLYSYGKKGKRINWVDATEHAHVPQRRKTQNMIIFHPRHSCWMKKKKKKTMGSCCWPGASHTHFFFFFQFLRPTTGLDSFFFFL